MHIAGYLKKNGIKHVIKIIWRYKIDLIIKQIMGVFLKNSKLKDIIVIESHNDFDCNGGAFYKYLIRKGYNKKYKIVWRLKNPKLIKGNLPYNVSWVH